VLPCRCKLTQPSKLLQTQWPTLSSVQFQTTVAYSLKDTARVSSILRQPKDFAHVVSNIMPSRVRSAAAVEVLWRIDCIHQRTKDGGKGAAEVATESDVAVEFLRGAEATAKVLSHLEAS
jgi:hypothetical protein